MSLKPVLGNFDFMTQDIILLEKLVIVGVQGVYEWVEMVVKQCNIVVTNQWHV